MSDPTPTVPTAWYRRSSFRSWWKSMTGFAVAGLTGAMTWRDTGIAAGCATLAASYDLIFGEDSYRAAP